MIAVYKLLFKDGSYYIGSSSQLQRRLDYHKRTMQKGYHSNPLIQAKYKELGVPQIITLKVLKETDDLLAWEQQFLELEQDKSLCLNRMRAKQAVEPKPKKYSGMSSRTQNLLKEDTLALQQRAKQAQQVREQERLKLEYPHLFK